MKSLIILIRPLIISVNSFGSISKIQKTNTEIRKKIDKISTEELIDRIEQREIAKDYKNIIKRQSKHIKLVNYEHLKLKKSLVHIKKCIKEESDGTRGIFDGKFNVE